jgi:hypothetical protein
LINERALDLAARRFPRILAECARFDTDFVRQVWLASDGDTVQRIIAEYQQITGKEHRA